MASRVAAAWALCAWSFAAASDLVCDTPDGQCSVAGPSMLQQARQHQPASVKERQQSRASARGSTSPVTPSHSRGKQTSSTARSTAVPNATLLQTTETAKRTHRCWTDNDCPDFIPYPGQLFKCLWWTCTGYRINLNLGDKCVMHKQCRTNYCDGNCKQELGEEEEAPPLPPLELQSCGVKGRVIAEAGANTHNEPENSEKQKKDGDPSHKIVNGQPATACEWRWQVGLHSNDDGDDAPFCGGMLIHPEWVLTAAHCVGHGRINVVAGDYHVHFKEDDSNSWSYRVMPHPQYDRHSMEWDLALIRLASPMPVNNCIGTVCLPTEGADVEPGTKCWITGWGTTQSRGAQPNILQEAEVDILSQQACRESGYEASEIHDSMICAQGMSERGVTDACQGDSGGPLVCEVSGKWTVYGATSWGFGCARGRYPGVWARVHEGLGWIQETMKANGEPLL